MPLCVCVSRYRLHIVGEVTVDVNHQLLALPGIALSDITRVISHWQASCCLGPLCLESAASATSQQACQECMARHCSNDRLHS